MIAAALFAAVVAAAPFRVDLHAHVTMARAARPLFRGEPGRGPVASAGTDLLLNQVEAESLLAAGVRVVVVALWPPFDLRPGLDALDEALGQLRALDDFARDHPEFAVARSAAEIERVVASDRIALFPMIEGGEGISHVEDLDTLFAAGARGLTLVHFSDSGVGGAMRMPNLRAFGWPADHSAYRGLSPLGAAVVRRMIALGMVLDLCHASEATAAAALELTEAAGVPVLLSHVTSWELTPFEPNVPDALAQRVVDGGGLIGVSAQRNWGPPLAGAARLPGHVDGSCDDVIAQWAHYFQIVRPEAVALGSDFNGFIVRPGTGGSCPAGLSSTRGLAAFFEAVAARTGQRAAVDRSGDAFLAFLREVEARGEPSAQAEARRHQRAVRSAFDSPL